MLSTNSPSTTLPGTASCSQKGAVALQFSWCSLDVKCLQEMERVAIPQQIKQTETNQTNNKKHHTNKQAKNSPYPKIKTQNTYLHS